MVLNTSLENHFVLFCNRLALTYSDRAIEAYDVLVALLESELGLLLANCRAAGIGNQISMKGEWTLACLLTYGAEPFLRRRQLCSYSRTSQHFMEPKGSLLCSQQLSTGPYPQPDRSSPYHPILSL
jgi:hypothetical protein